MKVILENELEKWAWSVMLAAHYKWEKNYGRTLQDQMGWYFEGLHIDQKREAVQKEVERRLRDVFDEEFFTTEDEYLKSGLEAYNDEDFTDEEEKQKLKQGLREEYREVQKDISEMRERISMEVEHKLRQIYYTFFNAPENLTVIYNDEIIQGKVRHAKRGEKDAAGIPQG
jgi:hypothetical protein